ncbi:hypothetical protein F383_31455 [Gossypium arboreum]|uniref:Uncharacterized protein n=1 Tax=Gossypium arboreum TaxID=29729 RepID=A0A0B0PJ52_GOSAR|nr:hypothetical protein F383_31455 [Gossypium arboreum]
MACLVVMIGPLNL